MTKFAKIVLIVAGVAVAKAQYTNSSAKYMVDLECANCIRSGNDFCLYIGGQGNGTIVNWNCSAHPVTPEWNITSSGGVPGGYMCSKGMADQMNAIVNGCRPWLNQNTVDYCGSYFVDLTDSNSFPVGRSIEKMPANSSCSYRAISNCGYPEVEWRVHDPTIQSDFDIAWATMDNLDSGNELDGWEPEETTEWKGSYGTTPKNDFSRIGFATRTDINVAKVDDNQWNTCKGIYRNLWITVTRTKDSRTPAQGLAQTPRQLVAGPYYPNGTFSSDFELNFYNKQGPSAATALIGAFGVAVAGLAALAF